MDWLQTWDPKTVAAHRPHAGKRLDHTGSDQFPEREIDAGDRIFVGYVGDGHPERKHHLYLIGSLIVEAPGKLGLPEADRGWLTRREAESYLGTTDIWDARAHVIARRRSSTPMRFGLEVPESLLPRLTFLVRNRNHWDHTYLKLNRDRTLVGQTVRRVRRLDPDSATALSNLLRR